jgi:hypothetical protein
MGVLDVAGAREDTAVEETVAPVEETTSQYTAPERAERARAEDGTFVPAEKLKPETRRTRAKEQISTEVETWRKNFEETVTRERQTWQQEREADRARLQQQAEAMARMQGALEEMRSRPVYQAPQQQGPDPKKLFAEAKAALAAGNMDEYHDRQMAAYEAMAEAKAANAVKTAQTEWQRTQPPQIRPDVMALLGVHPNVAKVGLDRGLAFVANKEDTLALYGWQKGPQRTAKAFELAEKELAAGQQQGGRPAGFDQGAAAALSGAPSARGGAPTNGGGNAAGVHLTGERLEAQRRSGMSPEDYVKWSDPHKYGLV